VREAVAPGLIAINDLLAETELRDLARTVGYAYRHGLSRNS
jgi:hypothetical protein